MAAASCEKHPFEVAETACFDCGHDFCIDCLVFARGPKKPRICLPCSVVAAGVRSTAAPAPKYDKKSMKLLRKQLIAELKEEQRGRENPIDHDALPSYVPPTPEPVDALPPVAGSDIALPGEESIPAWKRSWSESWDTPAFQPGNS